MSIETLNFDIDERALDLTYEDAFEVVDIDPEDEYPYVIESEDDFADWVDFLEDNDFANYVDIDGEDCE